MRIDRRTSAKSAPGFRWWLVLDAIGLLAAMAFRWSGRTNSAGAVETAVAREQAVGGPKTLLNASSYVTARRAAIVFSKVTGKVVQVLVEEGAKVEAEHVLAQLESATKLLEETKPNLAFAERELKRFTELATTKVVSDSNLRRAEAEARALNARLIRQTAEVAVAEREVVQWKQQLDDTVIRAPFAGVVTSKNARPGEIISPMSFGGFTQTGICTIVDMSSLEIEVDVNESYINRIQSGQTVE